MSRRAPVVPAAELPASGQSLTGATSSAMLLTKERHGGARSFWILAWQSSGSSVLTSTRGEAAAAQALAPMVRPSSSACRGVDDVLARNPFRAASRGNDRDSTRRHHTVQPPSTTRLSGHAGRIVGGQKLHRAEHLGLIQHAAGGTERLRYFSRKTSFTADPAIGHGIDTNVTRRHAHGELLRQVNQGGFTTP